MIKVLGKNPRISTPTRVIAFSGKRADVMQNLAPKADAQKEKAPPSIPGTLIETFLYCLPGAIAEGGLRYFFRGIKAITKLIKKAADAVFA